MVEILKGVSAIDLSLLIGKTLVISDVHIGFEEALNRQGVLVPRDHFPQLIKRMEHIFEKLGNKKIERIIINGDLKHEFGRISEQEWRNTLKFLDFLGRKCEKIVLIKGNHDTILDPIAKKRNLEIVPHFFLEKEEVLFIHGDKLPEPSLIKKAKTIVIGHEHASVSLRLGPRKESYKCFLVGKYKGKNLIVLPSLNLLTIGSAMMHEDVLSPFLKQDTSDFRVFIIEDKVYSFGKLKDIGKIG